MWNDKIRNISGRARARARRNACTFDDDDASVSFCPTRSISASSHYARRADQFSGQGPPLCNYVRFSGVPLQTIMAFLSRESWRPTRRRMLQRKIGRESGRKTTGLNKSPHYCVIFCPRLIFTRLILRCFPRRNGYYLCGKAFVYYITNLNYVHFIKIIIA